MLNVAYWHWRYLVINQPALEKLKFGSQDGPIKVTTEIIIIYPRGKPVILRHFTRIQKCQPHDGVALDEKTGDHQLQGFIVWEHTWNMPVSNFFSSITLVERGLVNQSGPKLWADQPTLFPWGSHHYHGLKTNNYTPLHIKELMWKMIDPSLCFRGHIRAQTKTSRQRRGSVIEAENIWPSSKLALSKLEHFSQGRLASMFIGLFRDKCVCACAYECVRLHPCVFPHDFETGMMGLVRKKAEEDFASSQFECECEWCSSQRASAGEKCYSQIQLH